MSRFTCIIILLLPANMLYAQKNANHWVFGDSVWLEFTDTGIIQRKTNIYSHEGASSINNTGTDSLLFYATPNTVYASNGKSMVSGLYGHHSAAQGVLFLRHPDTDGVIHLFTSDDISSSPNMGLYHHIFDSAGNPLLINDTVLYRSTEQLSAVNHRNNRDVWIVAHKKLSDSFYMHLLRDRDLVDCPIIQSIGSPYTASHSEGTILKCSPTGEFLATTLLYSGKVEIYRFNSESGLLANPLIISNLASVHGAEFSPNSQQLYVTSSALYQFDLSNFDNLQVKNSMVRLSPYKSNTGYIQLGIDGRIYLSYISWISANESKYLSVVHNPNKKGSNCDFEELGFAIKHGEVIAGLPTFNQSHFHFPSVDFSYREDCHTLNYGFEATDTFNAANYTWSFTNPDSTLTDTATGQSVSYQFADTGRWTVQVIASNGTKEDTATKTITIRPTWKPDFLGNDTFYCTDTRKDFTLKTPPNMHCVHWLGNPAYGQVDTFVADTAGTYFVKVTNKSFCTTYDTITIQELPNPAVPPVIRTDDTLFCQTDSVSYQWFRDGQPLTGENGQSLTLAKNGNYTVTVFNDYGCAATSVPILVDDVSVRNLERFGVRVFPNPASESITIDWSRSKLELQSAQMVDILGRTVLNQSFHSNINQEQLSVSQLAVGTYILELKFDNVTLRDMIVVE